MFKLDNNFLTELGLGTLPPQEKNMMLRHIYETLELRVGMKLAEQMSNDQLDEFERLMPLQTDSQEVRVQKEKDALTWLESNFPNYKQVVADELEKLKAEVKQAAPQIVAASQQALAEQQANGGTAPVVGPQPPATPQV